MAIRDARNGCRILEVDVACSGMTAPTLLDVLRDRAAVRGRPTAASPRSPTDPAHPPGPQAERPARHTGAVARALARHAALARSAIAPYSKRIVNRPRLKFLSRPTCDMPKTLVANQYRPVFNGMAAANAQAQTNAAVAFFARFDVTVDVKPPIDLPLPIQGRNFLAAFDWPRISRWCKKISFGVDLFVAPNLEPFNRVPIYGLTILPRQVPEGGWPRLAPPQVTRPAIYLNANAVVPVITLTHELGHAILDSLRHSQTAGNFMHENPGHDITALQIARIGISRILQ